MAQNDQIQALIQEIDEVLSKTSPRLPWVMSTDAMRQRQVLEQARSCLDKLQIPNSGLTDRAIDPDARLLPSGQPAAESAQQVLQAVLQEMTYLRVNMLQPMRSDVDLLRQQREALTQEIRQLEAQRQQYVLPQQGNPQLLMEFLQSAMGQMQENLRGQVTQMIASLTVEGGTEPPLLHGAGSSENMAIAALSPVQRLEQIQRVQTQSDQLLLKLDSTLQVIFDSLQNNIQSYQESLEQGLSRMHSLGQQGEVMFSALVTRLAEQLGKEASVYLQAQTQQPAQPQTPPHILEGDRLALSAQQAAAKGALDESADAEITRLLEELNALAPTPAKPPEPNSLEARWQPQPFVSEVGSLEALDQELQQLDLAAMPLDVDIDNFSDDDDDLTFFQADQEFSFPKFSSEDATRIQDLELEQAIQDLDPVDVSSAPSEAAADSRFEDLESALDLLNQLSAEAEAEPDAAASPEIEPHESAGEPPEAIAPLSAPSQIDSPDHLYKDEFYQSLFGDAEDGNQPSDLGSHLTNLHFTNQPTLDSPSEMPESKEFLSFELDTENEWVQSLDLKEWFQEDALSEDALPAPQPNSLQPDDQQGFITDQAEVAPSSTGKASLPNEDLFGGVSDPAVQPVRDAEADFLPDFSISPLPQSVETFLLSDPAPLLESAALNPSEADIASVEEDLFWQLAEEMQPGLAPEPAPEPAAVPPAVAAPTDTITALTDLISAYAASETQISILEIPESKLSETDALWPVAAPSELGVSEERLDPDAFEPANPGEDLLIPTTPQEMAIANFEIGEDTLQQLTADLSSLELPSAEADLESDITPQSANLEGALREDPLADLYLESLPEAAIASRADQIASTITLEDLLFTDELDSFPPDAVQPPVQPPADPQSAAVEAASSAAGNAFTLEGLDALFEGLPSALPNSALPNSALPNSEVPDLKTPDFEAPNAPNSELQPKKKI